ncbi:MAG: 2OG-Fe(II) oxygenase [Candidatus Acidoferrum typicum]|nr:2OG-Fe(II) oxygenase [Candidatus Acidoferrum typicum]
MTQRALFERGPKLPDGLIFEPDFLTVAEENELIEVIRTLPFSEVRMHGVVAKRRVAHFGLRYAFTSHQLSPASEIPDKFGAIRVRAAQLSGVDPHAFSEVLVTEYPPGAGIGWHRDAPPFGIIAGISLAANCTMRFRKETGSAKGVGGKNETAAIKLPQRSLYVLAGTARTDWQHSIRPIAETRYSITFRTLKQKS